MRSFKDLKDALTNAPILFVYPNFSKNFIVEVAASDKGMGGDSKTYMV